jgi:two-component system, response regulator / RNA-binding antiterminator
MLLVRGMTAPAPLRIVIVAPDSIGVDAHDAASDAEAQRSRSLRIGLLEGGHNIVATCFCPSGWPRSAPT